MTEAFDGHAQWIWSAEGVARPRPDKGAFRVRYFRRVFDAPPGATLTVCVSADSRYKLWCNGLLVSRGPAKGDVAHQFYDTVELAPHLRTGPNVLAAQVEYYGDVWCHYSQGGASVSQMTAAPGFVLGSTGVSPVPGAWRPSRAATEERVVGFAPAQETRSPRDRATRVAGVSPAEGPVAGLGPLECGGSGQPPRGEDVSTDSRWKVLVDSAYSHQLDAAFSHCVGLMEDLDCARYPWGFTQLEFDDSSWPAATEVCPTFTTSCDSDSFMPHRLLPRMIVPLEESPPRAFVRAFRSPTGEDLLAWSAMLAGRAGVTVPAGREAVVLLDAGELTTAYPRLELTGGAGATITLRYAEALTEPPLVKSKRNDLAFGDIRGCCDILRPDGPARSYEPFCWRTFRFVGVEVRTGPSPLTIRALQYAFTGYPFKLLGQVQTSDPQLGAIRDLCWRTARLCAHDTYEDCPYYEQLQYAGDTQVQAMVSYVAAGDAWLGRQFLYQFDWSRQPNGLTRSRYPSRVPQTIPYWSLHWVMSIRDYWQYTGDRATVSDLLPGVLAVMEYFNRHLNPDGTVGRLDGWLVADWCTQWRGQAQDRNGCPPGSAAGCSAFSSLITLAALKDAAELASAMGQDDSDLRRRAESLRQAAHAKYFDPARGLYRDRPDAEVASAFTNVWAILAGMPCDHAALADKVVSDKSLCELTVFSTYFACRALASAGRYELVGRLLAPWRKMLGWGFTTCPETPDFVASRSDCHAWGAGPLVELFGEVLGVRPAEPGFAAIALEPKPAGLTFARGGVPLTGRCGLGVGQAGPPAGDGAPARMVRVEWHLRDGEFRLSAQTPAGIPCRVKLLDGFSAEFPQGGRIQLRRPWKT